MCTVTFIPNKTGFILTSSRDESIDRATEVPTVHYHKDKKYYYPRDESASGSWIGVSETGVICCLLNGAMEKHQKNAKHTRSRGLVLLDCLSKDGLPDYIDHIELINVEPFTLLYFNPFNSNKAYQFMWDGKHKLLTPIDTQTAAIWSSATLYSPEIRLSKSTHFNQFILQRKSELKNDALQFHLHKSNLFESEMLGLKTVSISQIIYQDSQIYFKYLDLTNNNRQNIIIQPCISETE